MKNTGSLNFDQIYITKTTLNLEYNMHLAFVFLKNFAESSYPFRPSASINTILHVQISNRIRNLSNGNLNVIY